LTPDKGDALSEYLMAHRGSRSLCDVETEREVFGWRRDLRQVLPFSSSDPRFYN
jgi:hypothetical protein